ncbi:MAG: hypothetical protein NC299_15175 [Lachnospiraceae bacterium]|nr:hypothetical protein [Ruminococcus sp.]MCM1276676.1 hypothetical protein [Lachnospiraceae bacterium]
MTNLNTINCEELMTQPLKPIEFVVDNLITQPTAPRTIFARAFSIKSFSKTSKR